MKNRVGLIIFGIGFIGLCLSIMALDSEVWVGAIVSMVVFALVSTVGYLLVDVEEVLEQGGLMKVKDSKEVRERKARNREIVWQTWLATK